MSPSRLSPGHPPAQFRLLMVSLLAGGIGLAAGFIAYGLYSLIGFFSNLVFFQRVEFTLPSLQDHHLGLWVLVVPALGGLIVGLMARYGSSRIRGHGIPEAMEAVLVQQSRIEPRVALLKPLSAAIAIGTGGPFGAEGPIIQTGGAFGSLVGQLLHTTASERKVLLACGAAAGMAATFSTPIAAVILAIELLLFEFKTRSFIPLVIASTLATSVHVMLLGPGPMFDVGRLDFRVPAALPFYLLLGLVCGLAAVAFTKALYWTEDRFERLPLDPMWHPAIAGVALGVISFYVPRVLGVGYDTISDILASRLTVQLLLLVLVFKSLALLISLGSGTSGGLLAPMFMASAALGAVVAALLNRIVPGAHLAPGAFALVAMGAVFGAASRATFTFIIFAFEITRDYNAVLPLMLVAVIADGIGLLLMPTSIMTEKLARRGLRIHQDYEADVLQQVTVGETMIRDFPTLSAGMRMETLAERLAAGDPYATRHYAFLLLDDHGDLAGILTRGDIVRALNHPDGRQRTVLEAGTEAPITILPDQLLSDAASLMLRHDIGRLPVVNPENPQRVVGYLGRSGIMAARVRRLEEEHIREPGWLGRVF
ncbi:MAG TPA: chloride channel protein [Terriglobales bacterium]|nr:chloride channel protein [Terriglobales bacterium]